MSSKTIKNIVENLREISEDGVQIATLAQVLVNDNPIGRQVAVRSVSRNRR